MKRALFLIRAASLMVPGSRRGDWRREWEAELHHACGRGVSSALLLEFACGAFHDAAWHGRMLWNRDYLARRAQSAGFCLGSLAALILVIAAVSGFLPATRMVLFPLPYRDASRVATVTQAASFATRAAIRPESVRLWQKQSRTLEDTATYSWIQAPVPAARVSDNFFSLLGARTRQGRAFQPDDLKNCRDCVVLSANFWRGQDHIYLGGKPYRVAAVLDKSFWFLSPRIAVWMIGPPTAARTGVVARLRPDANGVEAELGSILHDAGANGWDTIIALTPLPARVRSVLGSYAFALALAVIVILPVLRLRMPRWNPRAAAFFAAKTALALAAVLLGGLEFTRAASITVLGGTDLFIEPLSTWLFLMGCMGALFWSIQDQRRRCRVCLRRLGLAAHVGCPGCLLLDWAGTELVCIEGHGMLHVPEFVACWQEPDRWTALDDSWRGLFQQRT